MSEFWINSAENSKGEYELHEEGCPVSPEGKDTYGIGNFSSCEEALFQAKQKYAPLKDKIVGCTTCFRCTDCHLPCKAR